MTSCAPPNHRERIGLLLAGWKNKVYEIDGKKWVLPIGWTEQADGFRNKPIRCDDVWIMGQLRCGTTLTQELVWLLENNLDFETAKKYHVFNRSPYYEVSLFPVMWEKCQIARPSGEDPSGLEFVPVDSSKHSYEVYADLPSPRVFKSHIPLSVLKCILDSGCKIIYLFRNPKDSFVSRARLYCCGKTPIYAGSLESFLRAMIHPYGLDKNGEYVSAFVPFWPHVKEAWAQRHHPNLLFMYYEDYRTDFLAAIKKVAAFLGKEYSNEQLDELADHLDIDKSRKNAMLNTIPGLQDQLSAFVGKGRVGGWGEVLTPELESDFDRWIEENTRGTTIADRYLKK